jgi:anthranilate phosphoribosyltransferase
VNEYPALLRALTARQNLDSEAMAFAIGAIVDAEWSEVQAAGILTALATKGETVDEVVGAAGAMRARSLRVEHALGAVVDTCGTGGDGAHTINISTAAGFVVAGTGLPVAKHGNRAASSRCGSADVLEACGIAIDATPERARAGLERTNFTFMFAQAYHPSMKAVAPVRRQLGVRTIFNLLGPLTNPAGATHQVIGVADPVHLELLGEALERLGGRAGAIVHSSSGLDEIGGDAPSDVYQFGRDTVRRWRLDPAEFDVRASREDLAGGSPPENAAALRAILGGERSPRADVVALNAALALLVAEHVESLLEGLLRARKALAEGSARAVFDAVRDADKTKMEIA